jgi:hypothetical protein
MATLQQVTTVMVISNLPMIGCRCPALPGPAWRFLAKSFCVNGLAAASAATPCSGSVNAVIADKVTAVPLAAPALESNSDLSRSA